MLLSFTLCLDYSTIARVCQHKNKKEDGKIHPLYIQNQLSNLPLSVNYPSPNAKGV